ncbi:MAG TPA: PEP-CTERM sorting domain-containing protein [Candidatus Acidoferrum sp.]|nr:PEP-CTERM sorting domain-containing protein [Candidatus Acidoferrum sp.]
MCRSKAFALLLALSTAALFVPSAARANGVPTRTQSSYGQDGPSYLQATGSSTSSGMLIDSQSLCPFSFGSPTDGGSCELSYAFQFDASTPIPADATGLTISVQVPDGSFLRSDTSFGILTDDNFDNFGGYNVFHTDGVSDADIAALNTANDISLVIDATTGTASITISDLSLLAGGGNGLAFYLDVASDAIGDEFPCDPSGTQNVCANGDLPAAPSPTVDFIRSTSTAPEPGTLLSLASGLGLLGLYRRRWAR